MKNSILVGALWLSSLVGLQADQVATTAGSSAQKPVMPAPTDYRVVDLGANHRVWQRETYEQGPDGQVMTHVHSYTELASGMNYQDASGQWTESKELIESFPSGAVARQGQYQVIFADNLNSAGSIDMQTTDGKRLRSNILGLMYVDTVTGDAVMVAEIQDTTGELTSPNQVLYPNAFAGVKADVQYTYKRGSFEQDVILREQPPAPDAFGLNPDTTELEVVTEFIDPPTAAVQETTSGEPGLEADENINWGATGLGRSKAFNLGSEAVQAPVAKRYVTIQGRHFLLEKVRVKDIKVAVSKLPEQAMNEKKLPVMALSKLPFPQTPKASAESRPMRLASSTLPDQGYVLDYQTFSGSLTNYTFRGDLTYYISGSVASCGTNTFEGGTVLKFANNGAININPGPPGVSPGINWKADQYRPVVFTAKDDNSVGESIGTGTPSGYYGNPMLAVNGVDPAPVSGWRVAYAKTALSSGGINIKISNAQFMNCQNGLNIANGTVFVGNALFANVTTNFILGYTVVSAQNATFSGAGYLFSGGRGFAFNLTLTNCILASITNLTDGSATLTGGDNGFYNSPLVGADQHTPPSQPFQTVGAGSYYLTNGCGFQDVGTTNIDATLLADLKQRTTYPPIVYSNVTITATTLSPQAQRDTNTPDLGYHYDPLDYVFGGCDLYTNLTLTIGTAVGSFECYGHIYASGQPYGLSLNHGANLISTGIVTQPNWIVRAKTVQEWVNGAWAASGWFGGIMINGSGSGAAPQLNARFTKWATLASDSNHFRDNWAYGEVRVSHNEFYDGWISSYWGPYYFTNCLFHCTGIAFWDQDDAASLAFQNCTFYEGGLALCRYSGQSASFWNIQNTTFDGTAFLTGDNFSGNTNYTAFDYNAYNSSNTAWASYSFGTGTPTGRLETTGAHDVIVTNFNWQTSWLGNYYLPSDSQLIDAGSLTADQFGLYHFTTQTDQTKETNSIVDIGYHYVATDGYGNPLDSNGDGNADYLEDAIGTGQPLTITLITPTNYATFCEPATVPMQAVVFDWSGTVTNVTFYNGTNGLPYIGISPFNYTWPVVAAGSYSLMAGAYDNKGASSYSVPVTVNVTNLCGNGN